MHRIIYDRLMSFVQLNQIRRFVRNWYEESEEEIFMREKENESIV